VILVDTGPLVAVGSADDKHHQVCTELLGSATEELLVPATVSAEVCCAGGSGWPQDWPSGARPPGWLAC
jgi:predicted nucleic acid-binding protein